VAFNQTANVRTYSSRHGNTSGLHYGKQDYTGFKRGIKALCLFTQGLPQCRRSGAIMLPLSCDFAPAPGDTDGASLRGLEHWLFGERTRHKRRVPRALVKYHKALASQPWMTCERKHAALAAASARISSWSVAVAAETARLDAVRAYDGEYGIPKDVRPVAGKNTPPSLSEQQQTIDLDGANQLSKRRKTAYR